MLYSNGTLPLGTPPMVLDLAMGIIHPMEAKTWWKHVSHMSFQVGYMVTQVLQSYVLSFFHLDLFWASATLLNV